MDKQRIKAFENLEKKVHVLEKWLENEIPYRRTADGNREEDTKNGGWVQEWFPRSVSALRGWNGSKNSPATIAKYDIPASTTSQNAYNAIPEALRERIEGNYILPSLFERLKEQERIQRENSRVSNIKSLEDELAQAKLNHKGIAHEMVALALDNEALHEDNRVLTQQLNGLKLQHKTEIEWREKLAKQRQREIQKLEEQKQELHNQLIELMDKTGVAPTQSTPQTNIIELKRTTDE